VADYSGMLPESSAFHRFTDTFTGCDMRSLEQLFVMDTS
jgi:hypothetical protein